MTKFTGFPTKARQTPIPNLFFTAVLPFLSDLTELTVTLFLFNRLSWKRGYPKFVTLKELGGDLDLMSSLAQGNEDPSTELARGLHMAVARGTFLPLALERPDDVEHLYFLNTETDRRAIASVQRGQVDLGALPKVDVVPTPPQHRNIYALYEENVGMLSPLLAEELKEAEDLYPYSWIVDAFREAVRMNRRRWRYIQRILERWKAEGRPDGDDRKSSEENIPRPTRGRPRGGYITRRQRQR